LKRNPAGYADGWQPGAYYRWQTVKLAPSTGAVCGNGSQYKFFVNRVPGTRNTIVYMEGGGACWDYPSCTGASGIRGARNPNGIPDNYLDILANPGTSLVSPFIVRLHPYNAVKTQNWNMIYVPYCTGDVYSGDKVAVYNDPSGQNPSLIWHHNGLRNTRAVVAWLRDHLPRSTQMLSTARRNHREQFTQRHPHRFRHHRRRGVLGERDRGDGERDEHGRQPEGRQRGRIDDGDPGLPDPERDDRGQRVQAEDPTPVLVVDDVVEPRLGDHVLAGEACTGDQPEPDPGDRGHHHAGREDRGSEYRGERREDPDVPHPAERDERDA
jgi:hypothetical protein